MRSRLVVAGALLAACALAGCDPAGTLAAEITAATSGSSPHSPSTGREPGPKTLADEQGVPAPDPAPTSDTGLTVADLPLTVPSSSPSASTPHGAQPRQCGDGSQPRLIVPGVTAAGSGRLTVTWMTYHDPGVDSWRVAARDQTFVGTAKDPVWTTVAEASGCQQLTASLTGLVAGQTYVVWLVQVSSSPEAPALAWHQVGTSQAVVAR